MTPCVLDLSRLDFSRWDLPAMRAAFDAGAPFRHVVVDALLAPDVLAEVAAAFDDEPAERLQDEIMDVLAGPAPPQTPALRAVFEAFASAPTLSLIERITGAACSAVEMRAYVYQPGHYLLPHADRDAAGRRRIAFAFYVASLPSEDGAPLEGGELDLYEVRASADAHEVDTSGGGRASAADEARADADDVRTTITKTLAPQPNRCVFFEVGPHALHRVREVTRGARLSLAGWFLS